MTGPDAMEVTPQNPFVGPRPIEKGQPIFGRDPEITELYDLLFAERIVLLHSPSGAGKSSLIQAGLIPRLAEQFDVWKPVRVNLPPQSGDAVNRFVRSCNIGFEAGVPKRLQREEDSLSAMSLAEYVAGRPIRPSAPKNIILIFDQFEEILTVDPLGVEAKREFFGELGKLLQDNPRIWALFAIREDYLAPFDSLIDWREQRLAKFLVVGSDLKDGGSRRPQLCAPGARQAGGRPGDDAGAATGWRIYD